MEDRKGSDENDASRQGWFLNNYIGKTHLTNMRNEKTW